MQNKTQLSILDHYSLSRFTCEGFLLLFKKRNRGLCSMPWPDDLPKVWFHFLFICLSDNCFAGCLLWINLHGVCYSSFLLSPGWLSQHHFPEVWASMCFLHLPDACLRLSPPPNKRLYKQKTLHLWCRIDFPVLGPRRNNFPIGDSPIPITFVFHDGRTWKA